MTTNPCRTCGGPCRFYAGDVHQWTCRTCLGDYIAQQNDAPTKTVQRVERRSRADESD